MRILIVDDEMVSRTKLETVMAPLGDVQSVDCGVAAIQYYEQALDQNQGYDLIMLDIDMPDLQGGEVLQKVRKLESFGPHRAAVVMVTALSDQDHVLASVKSGCDEYVVKPFDPKTIHHKLIHLGLLEPTEPSSDASDHGAEAHSKKIFEEICSALRAGLFKLPVQPSIGVKFRKLTRNNADVDQMANLLLQDMTISARLVQMANSALYCGYSKVQTVEQAIGRLGLTATVQLVTALANHQLFVTDQTKYKSSLNALWQHSLASAFAAELLTQSLKLDLIVDPFCAGLFHDIGVLALLNIIAQLERRGCYQNDISEADVIETIAAYHPMFGAKLLEKWKFDVDYSRAAMSHNNLYTAESLTIDLLVVHFANLLAKSLDYTADGQPCDEVDLVKTQSAIELKLDAGQIDVLQGSVKEHMVNAAGVLT